MSGANLSRSLWRLQPNAGTFGGRRENPIGLAHSRYDEAEHDRGVMMRIKGKCACGNVIFEVSGEPIVQLYCHCRSCQLAHAAPVVAAAIFPANSVTYQGNIRRITVTGRADASRRLICASCGTKVINEPLPPVRAILPVLCESTEWFKPQMHVQWQDRTLDVRDDLPKFLDYPRELGGTGAVA
jgi:hypothetical protein